jgi:hypothetical protein
MLFSIPKIRREDIVVIRVIRPNPTLELQETQIHISEIEYMKIPYDVIITNDGTIESYINKFEKIIDY